MKKLRRTLTSAVLVLAMLLSMVTIASAAPDYVWLEAEEGTISGYSVLNMHTTSGGKAVLLENSTGAAGSVEFEFTIAEAGEYNINILSSAGNVNYLSRYKWSLDGSTPAYNDNASIGTNSYTAGMLMTSQPVKWYPITTTNLTAGTHTIVISCDEKRTLNNANDFISHFFDCVAVVPSSWDWVPSELTQPEAPSEEPVGPAEDDWFDLEAEEGVNTSGNTHTVGENTYVWSENAGEQSATVSFNAKEGTYDVWALIGLDNFNGSYPRYGRYDFYLNDSDTKFGSKYNNNLDVTWIEGGLYTTRVFVSYQPTYMHWVKVGEAIELAEGINKIKTKFEVMTHQCGALDKIRVVPSSWNHTPTDITTPPSEPVNVDVTGIEIEEATLDMTVGDHYELTYEVLPAAATDKSVIWVSSNPAAAAVAGGTITALSAGTATITGTTADGGFTDTCVVTVTGEAAADDSGCAWLEAENAIISGTGYTISNEANASGGKVFQTEKRNADPITLTMIYEIEEAGEYDIKILATESTPGHLTNYKVKIDGGEAATVPATTNPSVYSHHLVTGLPARWHHIATMNLAEGTHTITVVLDALRPLFNDFMLAYIDVVGVVPTDWDWDVTTAAKPQAPVAVEEIDIIEDAIELSGGETYELSYEVYPENASASDVVWSSSNTSIATVENGVVTALSGGTATITAESAEGEGIDTCEVTVLAAKVNSALIKIANVTNIHQPGVGTNNGIVQVASAQAEGTVYEFDIPFTAPKEGTYDVYFTGSPSGVAHASSYKEYRLDGVSRGVPSSSRYYAAKGYANKADSTLAVNWYKLDELELDENEHVLTFVFDKPRSMEDNAYMFALEYLLLVPKGTTLKLSSTKATGGEQAAENLAEVLLNGIFIEDTVAADDLLLHMNALDGSEITWTSSNPDIIDEFGNVSRPGYYEEDATVTLTASISVTKIDATITATKEFVLTVPKKEAYTVKDFDIANDGGNYEATVQVSNNTNETKTAVLVLAHYNAEGAMVAVDTDTIPLTADLQTLTATLSGAEAAEGDTIEAFLWTDFGTKELIQGSIVTYEN